MGFRGAALALVTLACVQRMTSAGLSLPLHRPLGRLPAAEALEHAPGIAALRLRGGAEEEGQGAGAVAGMFG